MEKSEFYVLNSCYNGSIGRAECTADISMIVENKQDVLNSLENMGYITDDFYITEKGRTALKPYRVDNAVILAAGASSRFIPLSLERPKGLFEVKGERLIERQIRQLQDAGIKDITVVIGYKKEMFYYLREQFGVNLIVNESFNIKNNIESLYQARDHLKNTYVCVSDSFFVDNPFQQYEYDTFYAGIETNEKTNEMYVQVDDNNLIKKMMKGCEEGKIVFGHSFWKKEFSDRFIQLAAEDRTVGNYNSAFWEWLVRDNLEIMPPMYFKQYRSDSVFEFDYFEDLRKFDEQYLGNTHSNIIRNIKLIFRCDEEDIKNFRNVSEGLTNTSFIFKIEGKDYIYRHPGDGTEEIINRKNEKTSLIEAKKLNIDPTYIYEDVNEGWKISEYITDFREPDYDSFEDSKKVLNVMRKVHNSGIVLDYGLNPWKESNRIEFLLEEKSPGCFAQYKQLKQKIETLVMKTENDGVQPCFCHGDTYKPNWMIRPDGSVVLIDWEYSGMSDPGIDVGYYIVDAMYDFETADAFIREYLQENATPKMIFHFMAYVAIIAYYWFVWALYRESCGASMPEVISNWHEMAKEYADYLCKDN